ncbi:unnamed protein product [Notodromas monacha]|uniref:BPTI/Kunitz inhibitor domain-containing protein n=1 Tax=Notodromas monacha TaxID=399045 RepID=A0A7R9GF92_9CRUS|nr:unnamed protein product [Notodromas monacha]CAG0920458.1 unnamed protein product [Notodromas monacha]
MRMINIMESEKLGRKEAGVVVVSLALLFARGVHTGYVEAAVVSSSDREPVANIKSNTIDCSTPPHPGTPKCRAWRTNYYYSEPTGTCESFIYSGCGGSLNRYETRSICEEVCIRRAQNYFRQKAGFKLPVDFREDEQLQYYGAGNPDFYQSTEDNRKAGFKLPDPESAVKVESPPVAQTVASKPVTNAPQSGGLRNVLNRVISNLFGG